jgi:ABC-2 type transport system ATP-binding protein
MRVFAQLVDDATGLVVGNQVTPIDVTLDGQPHEVTSPLEIVSYTTHPGQNLTLQLVATTVAYATPQLGGSIDFSAVHVELPVVTGLQS